MQWRLNGDNMTPDSQIDQSVLKEIFAAQGKSFRGSIPEFIKDVPMGRGYENKDSGGNYLPFDITTAWYTKPVFDAIQDPDVPVVSCMAAVQMLKTFICCEASPAYFIAQDPGDTTIYLGSQDSGDDQSRGRMLPWWREFKDIAKIFKMVKDGDRFDLQTQELYLPGQIVRIWGLNEGNTARITLRRVIGSDLYLSKKTGLWQQAMARTTQVKNRKIIGESQGGEVGDDMHEFHKTTDMGWIWVKCPLCGTGQPFDFHRDRLFEQAEGKPFQAIPTKDIPSLEWSSWINHFTPILMSPERRHCGFQRGNEKEIKNSDGSYNKREILRQTYYECFHCGQAWHDAPQTRKELDLSSYYVPTNTNALIGRRGFSWPSWAGQRLRWGGPEVMLEYLEAKQAQKEFNSLEKLKQWYNKRYGRPWSDDLESSRSITISPSSYDPVKYKELMGENFHSVDMVVDCQEDADHKARTGASITGWFWFIIRAVDKFSNSIQLARGFCKSWESWIAVQKHFKVPNDRVMIDGIFDGEGVLKKAIECREMRQRERPHWRTKSMEEEVTWKLLIADKRQTNYKHPDKTVRPFSPETRAGGYVLDENTNKPRWIEVPKIYFNKDPVRFQIDALYTRAPGLPKFEFLNREQLLLPDGNPDTLTLQMETGKRTYEMQMQAQKYDIIKKKYVEDAPDDHYYFCEQGFIVRAGMDGLFSHQSIFLADEGTPVVTE